MVLVMLVATFSGIETFWQGCCYQLIGIETNQIASSPIGFTGERWGVWAGLFPKNQSLGVGHFSFKKGSKHGAKYM